MFLLRPLTQTECTRQDTLGPLWVRVPVWLSCVCMWVFRKRGGGVGGVDCQFTEWLRHSQYTLMVNVVSTGRKRAEFLARHASCFPLSELRAVILWEARERQEKQEGWKTYCIGSYKVLKLKTSHHGYVRPVVEEVFRSLQIESITSTTCPVVKILLKLYWCIILQAVFKQQEEKTKVLLHRVIWNVTRSPKTKSFGNYSGNL